MSEVKLLAAPLSLFCYRVEWALKLKGVEYEYLQQDLLNKSSLLLKSNPVHKKVPVLLHEGKAIAESVVILEYIDETWKNSPLMPEDPYERAMARFWAKLLDEKCVFGALAALNAEGDEKEKLKEPVVEALKHLDELIQGKKFFGGERIGFLDIVVGSLPQYLSVVEEIGEMKIFDSETFPSLHEWAQNFGQIPVIKECLPPKEKMINYFRESRKYMQSLAAKK